MRRLGRYILNTLTGLSLLLFAATVVAWPISYRTQPYIYWCDADDAYLELTSYRGAIYLAQTWDEPTPRGSLYWGTGTIENGKAPPTGVPHGRIVPISYYRGPHHPARLWGVSHWFVLVLTAAMPVTRAVRRRRAQHNAALGVKKGS